jgi:hypothetical protein
VIAERARASLLAGLLGALCLVLIAAAWRIASLQPSLPQIAAQPPGTGAQATIEPISFAAFESFAAATARPLFAATRRPYVPPPPPLPPPQPVAAPAPPPPPAPAAPPLPALTLVGVTFAEGQRFALVVVNGEPAARVVAQGRQLEGWTLSEIRPDRITLRHGDTEHEIRFPEGNAAAARRPGVERPAPHPSALPPAIPPSMVGRPAASALRK